MALHTMTDEDIKVLRCTDFATLGVKERADLQRLLRKNIHVIANEIGDELLVISEEFSNWENAKRRIDLLAVDKLANLVVIELKCDDGSHMELQAIRYAGMVARMTFDQAIHTYGEFLKAINDDRDARKSMLEFLEWVEPDADAFAADVRIVLVSGEFSQEITSAVLWLNEKDLDIRCVRLTPYLLGNNVILNAEQIIPLPEAEQYQSQIRQKKQEERKGFKQKSDPPASMTWGDEPSNPRVVSSWKFALVEGIERALKLGLNPVTLPIPHNVDGSGYSNPYPVKPDLYIETHGSADAIRRRLSKAFKVLGKPKGFLRISTASGKTFDLPEDSNGGPVAGAPSTESVAE